MGHTKAIPNFYRVTHAHGLCAYKQNLRNYEIFQDIITDGFARILGYLHHSTQVSFVHSLFLRLDFRYCKKKSIALANFTIAFRFGTTTICKKAIRTLSALRTATSGVTMESCETRGSTIKPTLDKVNSEAIALNWHFLPRKQAQLVVLISILQAN